MLRDCLTTGPAPHARHPPRPISAPCMRKPFPVKLVHQARCPLQTRQALRARQIPWPCYRWCICSRRMVRTFWPTRLQRAHRRRQTSLPGRPSHETVLAGRATRSSAQTWTWNERLDFVSGSHCDIHSRCRCQAVPAWRIAGCGYHGRQDNGGMHTKTSISHKYDRCRLTVCHSTADYVGSRMR